MDGKTVDILILEPDTAAAEALARALPVRVHHAFVNSIPETEDFMNRSQPRLFLCADDLPGETGLMFLARTEQSWPGMKRVLMAPDLDGELFFHAMREVKIFSYLNKPVDRGELIRTIHHALRDGNRDSPPPEDEKSRDAAAMPPWLRMLLVGAAIFLGSATVIVIFLCLFGALYEAKSLAGIDIFPDWHLSDLFRR